MRWLVLVGGKKIGDTRVRCKLRTACDLKLQVDQDPRRRGYDSRAPCAHSVSPHLIRAAPYSIGALLRR